MTSPPGAGGVDGGIDSDRPGKSRFGQSESATGPDPVYPSTADLFHTAAVRPARSAGKDPFRLRARSIRLLAPLICLTGVVVIGCGAEDAGSMSTSADLGSLVAGESGRGNGLSEPDGGWGVESGAGNRVADGAGPGADKGDGGPVVVSGDPHTGRAPTAGRLAEVRPAIEAFVSSRSPGAQITGIELGVEYETWSGAVVRLSGETSLAVTLVLRGGDWKVAGATAVRGGS